MPLALPFLFFFRFFIPFDSHVELRLLLAAQLRAFICSVVCAPTVVAVQVAAAVRPCCSIPPRSSGHGADVFTASTCIGSSTGCDFSPTCASAASSAASASLATLLNKGQTRLGSASPERHIRLRRLIIA